ncbi:protein translocase subunit SecE [Bombiscardovia nodaiensis]|uniref:Protein translocase subunit SecE n=1 Tax=Bombiscardovia nodaiensis TaxID=2932181 RepID=A0ABM8B9U3_9BIFI|nr:protein translocase subunit SecE [Bombiscardovia nodaiensis]
MNMAQKDAAGKSKRPNIFKRIGMFIKQVFDEIRKVVAPTGKELLGWSVAVFIFVLFLMIFVTALDFGLGKLVMLVFG